MTKKLTCRIEQILYNGPVEYAYDFLWVVRDEEGKPVSSGESSSPGWSKRDCERGLDEKFPEGFEVEKHIENQDEWPEVHDVGGWEAYGGIVVQSGGNRPPWPDDVEAMRGGKLSMHIVVQP